MEIEIYEEYVDTLCPGSGITIWTTDNEIPFGKSIVGVKGVRAEKIGEQLSQEFIRDFNTGSPFDEYIVDQLIPFMGLVPGSKILVANLSSHSKTNIWITEQFLPVKFDITQVNNNLFSLSTRTIKE